MVVLLKPWKWSNFWSQIIEKYFQMDNFIYIEEVIEVIFCIWLLLHLKTFKIKSMFVVCSIPCLCIVKNGQKWPCSWGRESRKEWCHSSALPPIFFSVNSYDLKSTSLKIFCPSVIRGPCTNSSNQLDQDLAMNEYFWYIHTTWMRIHNWGKTTKNNKYHVLQAPGSV